MKLTDLLTKITPLPWKFDEPNPVKIVDAIYCTHAANVLPECVAALRAALDRIDDGSAESDEGPLVPQLRAALARAEEVKDA